MPIRKKQILTKQLQLIMFRIVFLMFCHSLTMAQELPVAYIPPFESQQYESVLASRVHALFRSQLSSTSRLSFFSEEAWIGILQTLRIQLTLDQLRETQTAIKIGEISSVNYVALGKISQSAGGGLFITIEWINLNSGLIERTFSFSVSGETQLLEKIKETVHEISKIIVKEGKVSGQNRTGMITLKKPPYSGWQTFDEFLLINDLNYAYGKVRISRLDADSAFAEIIYLSDQVRPGDRVVLKDHFQMPEQSGPTMVLRPLSGLPDEQKNQMLYNKTRQWIVESTKVEFLEKASGSSYFETQIKFYPTAYETLYQINVLIISQPGGKIVFEKSLECLETDLIEGLSVLINLALQRWEQTALVTRVEEKMFTINMGEQQNLRKGQTFIIKEPHFTEMIGRGVITEVFSQHALAKLLTPRVQVRAGCQAIFSSSATDKNLLQQTLQKISQRSQDFKEQTRKDREKIKRKQLAREKQKLAKTLPVSRLRFGYGHPVYQSKNEQRLFDWQKAPQMHLDWYLGKHPYFHWVLTYHYSHHALKDQSGFIYAHTGGAGARLTFPLFSKWVGYGKAVFQFNQYQASGDAIVLQEFARKDWQNYYLSVQLGMDFILEPGLSIFLEAGQRRKIETKIVDFEYSSLAFGIAIWY